jgi:mannose-6-phosphate isomerase-like protein (cupin superfamily)
MLKQIAKKTAIYFLMGMSGYLAIGYLFHLVIFPEDKPEIANYFRPGQVFYSSAEGFRQTVLRHEKGFVFCSLHVDPFAPGPPKHIHTDFDEFVEIHNGELSLWINGEVKKVHPGEKVLIPRGTPHKPFNETADTIRLKGEAAFPEKFAYNLVQVYGFMDNTPDFEKSGKTLWQMILFGRAGFDSYQGEGPPVIAQKVVAFLLTPVARLLGYKSYYKEYDPFISELND